MKYTILFTDYNNGATSEIDTITANIGYAADDYVADCKANADDEWNTMLENGEVELEVIEE